MEKSLNWNLLEEATGKSKKGHCRKGKIEKKDLSALEVETIEFKLSPEEQICSACGGKLECNRLEVYRLSPGRWQRKLV